jgi:hypothetical protein
MPRGGKRPGAGRPRSRRVRLQAYVEPELATAVERAADDACLEIQDWLRAAVKIALEMRSDELRRAVGLQPPALDEGLHLP